MAKKVDERVVKMTFDNKDFEKKVSNTSRTLDLLKKELKLDGVATAVDVIADRFSIMGIVGMETIKRVTNASLDMIKKVNKATIGQVMEGGKRRALNLEQAQFQIKGLGMDWDVLKKDIEYGVQDTAYGLDEAAKAAAQMGASGVQAGQEMKEALLGISGVAAMTGSSYEDIANIFVKVSGNGRLMGQELLQLSGRGLNVAAVLSDKLGVSETTIRQMVSKGQISFEVFSEAMHEAFGPHAKSANETYIGSLSNVKAALSRIGAEFYTPYLTSMRDLFNSLRPFLNKVKDALGPTIKIMTDWVEESTKRIGKFLENADPKVIIDYFAPLLRILKALSDIVRSLVTPITRAFGMIFAKPRTRGTALNAFADFLESLILSESTIVKLTNVIAQLFKAAKYILDVIGIIAKGVGQVLTPIILLVKDILIELAGWIGLVAEKTFGWNADTKRTADILKVFFDNVTKVTQGFADLVRSGIRWLKQSTKVYDAVTALKGIFGGLWGVVKQAGDILKDFFTKIVINVIKFRDAVKDSFSKAGDNVEKSSFVQKLKKVLEVVKAIAAKIWEALKSIGQGIKKFLGDVDLDKVLRTINAISLAGLTLAIRKFVNKEDTPGPLFENLKKILDTLNVLLEKFGKTIEAFTLKIKAEALMKLALAIGVLVGALWVLARIDANKLAIAGGAIITFIAGLVGALTIMSKLSKNDPTSKYKGLMDLADGIALNMMAKVLKTMATAVVILAGAMLILSKIDTGKLLLGLLAVIVLLGTFVGVLKLLQNVDAKRLSGVTTTLIGLSIAVKIIASAIATLGKLSTGGLIQGTLAILAVILALSLFVNKTGQPEKMVSMSMALVILGAALKLISIAIKNFAAIPFGELAKGFLVMLIVLKTLEAFIDKVNGAKVFGAAAALLLLTLVLTRMTKVLTKFAELSWLVLAKGLIALGASLVVLAVALNWMEGTERGALALLVAIVSLRLLAGVMHSLAKLKLGGVLISLVAIAGVLLLLVGAAYAVMPVLPAFEALGLVMLSLGASMALMGLGLVWGAAGLAAFVGSLSVSIKLILKTFEYIIEWLILFWPRVGQAIGTGIVMILQVIKSTASAFIDTIIYLWQEIFRGLVLLMPDVLEALATVLAQLLPWLVKHVPMILAAGLDIFIANWKVIIQRLPEIIKLVADTFVAVVKGVADSIGPIVDALMYLVVKVLAAIASAIKKVAGPIAQAVTDIVMAFISVIVEVFKKIMSIATDDPMAFLSSMGSALIMIAGSMLIAAAVGPAAIAGALTIAGFITIMIPVFAAVGGLSRIPGINNLLQDGGNLLSTLGYALGNFLGSIIGGFSSGVISGLSSINSEVLSGVKHMVEVILLLTAATFLAGVGKFLGFGSANFETFGSELVTFADYFVEYYNTIKDIKPEIVTSSANAAKALAALATSLPKQGGFLQKIVGTQSLEVFGNTLEAFGTGLKKYEEALGSDINADLILKSSTAATALAELEHKLPKHGGLKQTILGDADLETFGNTLETFGTGLKKYEEALGPDINADLILKSSTAATALVELEDKLPKHGGLKQTILGDADLETFGSNLESFAEALKKYEEALGPDIEADLITKSVTAATALAELEGNLPTHGGIIKSWFTGDATLKSFGGNLKEFGGALKDYADALGENFPSEMVESSANAAKIIAELAATLPESGGLKQLLGGGKDLGTFTKDLVPFAEGMGEFSKEFDGVTIDPELITKTGEAAKTLVDVNNALPETGGIKHALFTGEQNLTTFVNNLIPFAQGMAEFSKEFDGVTINPGLVESSGRAALVLTELNNNLPNTGGAVQVWKGSKDLGLFASKLAPVGAGIALFQKAIKYVLGDVKFDSELVESAGTAAKTLAEMNMFLPFRGGKLESWVGSQQTLNSFAQDLAPLGTGIADFQNALGDGIKTETIESASNAAKTIASINDNLPPDGGIVQLWSGSKQTLENFGESLEAFGEALKTYGEKVADLNITEIDDSVGATQSIVEVAKNLGTTAGWIKSLWEKDYTLDKFGQDLDSLGTSLKNYNDSVSELSIPKLEGALGVLEKLVDITAKLAGLQKTNAMSLFAIDLENVGTEAMDAFLLQFDEGEIRTRNHINTMLSDIVTELKDYKEPISTQAATTFGVIETKLSGISDSAYDLAKSIPNSVYAGLNTPLSILKIISAAMSIMSTFSGTLNSDANKTKIRKAFTSPLSLAITDIRDRRKAFEQAGKYLVLGFVKGIVDHTPKAERAGKNLGLKTLDATKNSVEQQSPSKAFFKVGKFSVMGFVNGLNAYADKAEDAGKNMGEASIVGLETALALAKLIMENDVEPTIKPVLDLSDVYARSNELNQLLRAQNLTASLAYSTVGTVTDYTTALNESKWKSRQDTLPVQAPSRNYSVNVNVEGKGLSRNEIREIAGAFEAEIKSIDERAAFSRGEEVSF